MRRTLELKAGQGKKQTNKTKQKKKNEVEFQNIRFPKRRCYIIWLFSAPRPGVTGFTCGRGSTLTGAVRAWGGLTAGVAPGAGRRRRRRKRGASTKMWEVEASPSKLAGFIIIIIFFKLYYYIDVNCDVYQEVGTGGGTGDGDATCLSSSDPDAEARTSRPWDINSSPCVTELWRTALLDTQRICELCQQHISPSRAKHGYKTGSHRRFSQPAVCCCSQKWLPLCKCYTRCY